MADKYKYVIIGNCIAGVSACEGIRQKDKQGSIAVLSDEPHLAYCRCLLPNYIQEKFKAEQMPIRDERFYKDLKIDLLLNKRVENVSDKEKTITTSDKKKIVYEKLLVATGASARFPKIKGVDKAGVFGVRVLKDADDIKKLLPGVKNTAILGGGLVGTKMAYSLRNLGKEVAIIVRSPHILSQMCDAGSAKLMSDRMAKEGIQIITGRSVEEITGDKKIKSVTLDDGKTMECQMVISAKGVSPNISLVKGSAVKTDWGIIADRNMKANVDDIYTAGDCAQGYDLVTQDNVIHAMWPNAAKQGRVAGLNMAGEKRLFEGGVGLNSLDYYGLPLISAGMFKADKDCQELIEEFPAKQTYKKLILKNNKIVGFILVNAIQNAGLYLSILRQQLDIAPVKSHILEDKFNYARAIDLLDLEDEETSLTADKFRKAEESLIYELAIAK
jgi:NAD(P)H-nitrite reductase large subunit